MTELAALNIKITGDSGDLTAAVNTAKVQLQGLETATDKAGVASSRMGGTFGKLGGVMGGARHQVQNVAYQLQDMAVQLQMGTRWTTVMAQQLPQLAGGTLAAGVLAHVQARQSSRGEGW
jgi:hypothetical protein